MSDPVQPVESHEDADPVETSVPDTLISLIIAFVIAMAFRGFVLEGYVIPTGSMAPTLLGEHALWTSSESGYVFSADVSAKFLQGGIDPVEVFDPMLGKEAPFASLTSDELRARRRPGDRVLVMKWLYTFFDPKRYDVIVFKNPTNSAENYIKRLVGLPNEELWLADGDVFSRPTGSTGRFEIRPKPDHVQRAVWQPIHHSEWVAPNPPAARRYQSPWGASPAWELDGRSGYRCTTSDQTNLMWNSRVRPIDDWNAFNMLGGRDRARFNTADVRIAASIKPDEAGLVTVLRIIARAHEYEFSVGEGLAVVRMRPVGSASWVSESRVPVETWRPGRVTNVEFWHVDQRMSVFIDGDRVVDLEYDWDPYERLEFVTGKSVASVLQRPHRAQPWEDSRYKPSATELSWTFSGSPLTLQRLHVDRDLYYQPDTDRHGDPAYGTHPERLAHTGPDQFFMLGDNNAASSDSRMWGDPDELVAEQIDPTPFLVHRKLLVGKAWSVYFPAPYAISEGGSRFVPDFGRMRFIR